MKQLIIMVAAIVAMASFAEDQASEPTRTKRKLNRELVKERWNARTGGEIQIPSSQRGSIVFVNAQNEADEALISEVAATFVESHKLKIVVERGEFTLPAPTLKGSASLFIICDANMPTILHAPENKWTMVNLARLHEGNGSKPQFYSERVKKEVTRGFCLLAGTQTSNYPDSLLTSVTKPADLDRFVGCRLQMDIQERFVPYLKGFGVTPAKFTTYLEACQQGWAPAPTNEVQQAIWDKVHQIPDKPITIDFDPKTDK